MKARESELEAAEVAAAAAATAVEVARRSHEEQRERRRRRAVRLDHPGGGVRERVGRPGGSRAPRPPPRDEVRAAFVDAGEEIVRRHDEAGASARTDAARPCDRRCRALGRLLRSLDLDPDDDFVKAHADVRRRPCRRRRQGRRLAERIARSGDLEREALEAEARAGAGTPAE